LYNLHICSFYDFFFQLFFCVFLFFSDFQPSRTRRETCHGVQKSIQHSNSAGNLLPKIKTFRKYLSTFWCYLLVIIKVRCTFNTSTLTDIKKKKLSIHVKSFYYPSLLSRILRFLLLQMAPSCLTHYLLLKVTIYK
jgi:hypothetical protein